MTTEQYLVIAITTLAAAIGHLYWRMDSLHRQCEADRLQCELDKKECEKQNDKLWMRISRLEDTQA